jgi:antagonist of KipI
VLRFERATLVALAGAAMPLSVGGVRLPAWRPVALPAGAVLEIGAAATGARCCLAVAGGIDVPRVLGSRATHQRAGIGGIEGRTLHADDELSVGVPSLLARRIMRALVAGDSLTGARAATWGAGREIRPAYSSAPVVRVVEGTHQRLLTEAARTALFEREFRVSPRSDRMGYRLDGPALALESPLELRSEAVAFGTVQLPPGGAPIVLMADRQTTGGYPRIGEVATVDLPLLAQLRPGDTLRFRPVSLADARRLYVERERDLALLAQGVRHRVG